MILSESRVERSLRICLSARSRFELSFKEGQDWRFVHLDARDSV
jgi:hypothetical protein